MVCSENRTEATKKRRKEQLFAETQITEISGERRENRRYAAELPLQYTAIRNGQVVGTGAGTTIDLSSTGTAFYPAEALEHGTYVEVAIAWPAEDANANPMHLVVSGNVVRSDRMGAAIRNESRELRAHRAPLAMAAI